MKTIPALLAILLILSSFTACEKTTYISGCDCDTTIVVDTTIGRFTIDTVETFAAGLGRPATIVFDAAGNLLVADFLNPGTIRTISPSGVVTVFSPGPGRAVTGIAIDPDGYVYGSYQDLTVKKIPPGGGDPVTFLDNLGNPSGIAFDGAGNLYVAEHALNRIAVFSPAGDPLKTITAGIDGPVGVLWHEGALYVANRFGGNIVRIDSLGAMSEVFNGGVPFHTINFDADGNLFMSVTGYSSGTRIYARPPSGNAVILDHEFAIPVGLAFDVAGRLYVANYGDGTISRVIFK